MKEAKGSMKEYVCPWDNCKFTQYVYYNPAFDQHTGKQKKKGVISTQVRCPKCNNFIETRKKEETGNLVGRKHVHW